MRSEQASERLHLAKTAAGHTIYRAVAGVPLGVAGAVSSFAGGVKSAAKGDFKMAKEQIADVPLKIVAGAGMSSLGALGSAHDAVYHACYAAKCGIAAAGNKVIGADKPKKGLTELDTTLRQHQKGQELESEKEYVGWSKDKIKKNSRDMTNALLSSKPMMQS